MSKWCLVPDIVKLTSDEWRTLREIRLSALRESPHAFLSTYERESEYSQRRWRAEFIRGDWRVGFNDGRPVSLIGITREPGAPADQCYLEYLWVAPEFRRSGAASIIINVVLHHLRQAGIRTVFLWVLDDNDNAIRLYKKIGFASSNHRQPLEEHPGRSEERMQLDLS
jgi:ribosomal protein S18 acetylase RimI-like enzyme